MCLPTGAPCHKSQLFSCVLIKYISVFGAALEFSNGNIWTQQLDHFNCLGSDADFKPISVCILMLMVCPLYTCPTRFGWFKTITYVLSPEQTYSAIETLSLHLESSKNYAWKRDVCILTCKDWLCKTKIIASISGEEGRERFKSVRGKQQQFSVSYWLPGHAMPRKKKFCSGPGRPVAAQGLRWPSLSRQH